MKILDKLSPPDRREVDRAIEERVFRLQKAAADFRTRQIVELLEEVHSRLSKDESPTIRYNSDVYIAAAHRIRQRYPDAFAAPDGGE